MIVTSNLLVNYSAPNELIEYFEKQYPDGEDIEKIFTNETEFQLLHFIIKFLKVSDEVHKIYNKRCNIVNSFNIYSSRDITNSHYIVQSKDIQYSEMVKNSLNVFSSKFVYDSTNIKDSNDVWESRDVADSQKIMLSKNISDSQDVLSSQNIFWSFVINNSSNIEGARAIFKSNNITNSYFCGFCNNLNNSLFCINISNKNYQIFNGDVDALTFEKIRDQLLLKLRTEDFNFISVNASGYNAEERYKTSVRFDHMFENLSADFYGWVSSLPNYSEDLFMSLFFRQLRSNK